MVGATIISIIRNRHALDLIKFIYDNYNECFKDNGKLMGFEEFAIFYGMSTGKKANKRIFESLRHSKFPEWKANLRRSIND